MPEAEGIDAVDGGTEVPDTKPEEVAAAVTETVVKPEEPPKDPEPV